MPEIDITQLNHGHARVDVEGTFAAWNKIHQHKPHVIWKMFDASDFAPWLDRVVEAVGTFALAAQLNRLT